MTILLARPYGGYTAGQTVQLPTVTENALVAAGFGSIVLTTASAPVTQGALSTSFPAGRVTIAIGASSVVVTCPACDVNSKVWAVVNQATADGTLLRVERIVPGAGSFTIYGTANATAATVIDWAILGPFGGLTATL